MDDELEIPLPEIVKELKKHIWQMIVVSLVGMAVASVIYVFFTEDEYTAQVKLHALSSYRDSAGNIRFDMTAGSSFASDFKELIETPVVLEKTCEQLGWEVWPKDAKINVEAVNGTRIINIEVTNRDPYLAMDAANTLSVVFIEYVSGWIEDSTIALAAQAILPQTPSNGKRVLMIPIALLGCFAASVLLIALIKIIDDRVDAEEDLSRTMQVNVLSHIEGYRPEMNAFIEQRMNRKMSLLSAVGERTRESIKRLALNLQFASMDGHLGVMTITSTGVSEGKSSVALMLACQFAQEGKSVLLVDMDCRSPMLGRYIGQRGREGVLEYLSGRAKFEDAVLRTRIKNLWLMDNSRRMNMILTSKGASEAMGCLIDEARSHFDLVIFDTPPLGMFVDAIPLAAKSDGTVVVVGDGMTRRRELAGVLEQLRSANVDILGVVFNFVHRTHGGYDYNKYNRYGGQHKDYRKTTDDQSEAKA